jgi:hypothetical protein
MLSSATLITNASNTPLGIDCFQLTCPPRSQETLSFSLSLLSLSALSSSLQGNLCLFLILALVLSPLPVDNIADYPLSSAYRYYN